MTETLDTYDPRWQERFASLSRLFKIHWALHAPREQLDRLLRRQQDAFEASFKTLAAFDAFMKGKSIEHSLCMAYPCRGRAYRGREADLCQSRRGR